MQIIGILGYIFFAKSCVTFATEAQSFDPMRDPTASSQAAIFSEIAYRDKRASKAEPTCEELRAMWIYSKRQSRAAETTNDLPMYRDPFAHNIWDTYPVRSSNSFGYRDHGSSQARSRGAGVGVVYGKIVHKAPVGSRLRNGMPNRMKPFEEVSRLYGTINRHMPDPRRRQTNFRVGGGGGPSMSEVPQAGSFQHLKELIRTERARELQEQRDAEEMAARAAVLKEIANGERRISQESRRQFLNSIQPYPEPKSVNYGYGQSQYVSGLTNLDGGLLQTGDKYNRDTMLHK
ncbi:uncharacterized protein [Venturia canescens]|uniref:uncharacterized protein n=1 Tax=Venturia canescens TaxID=32260 RepID=UPI001C9C0447|nr:uncharacterized protein LOC122413055 [Venturia canescens]